MTRNPAFKALAAAIDDGTLNNWPAQRERRRALKAEKKLKAIAELVEGGYCPDQCAFDCQTCKLKEILRNDTT